MEGFCNSLSQISIPYRIWRAYIDRPRDSWVLDQKSKNFGKILDMNPGNPLLAAPNRPSDIFFKERDHLTEGSSFFSHDDA